MLRTAKGVRHKDGRDHEEEALAAAEEHTHTPVACEVSDHNAKPHWVVALGSGKLGLQLMQADMQLGYMVDDSTPH